MHALNKNKAGLALGLLFGALHLAWAILVALHWAKPFMDWVLHLHFMDWNYSMIGFNILTTLWLIILTFVIGYIVGWAFAWLWNWLHKSAHQG